MRYFEVEAKCGHVGRNNYYKGLLYLWAEDGKHAARVARDFPRVKHDQKDAILSVREISRDEFEAGRAKNLESPYWTSQSIQQQRLNCPELEGLILHEEVEQTAAEKRYAKKHSLRKLYNDSDPMYTEFCGYQGTISLAQEG